MKIKWTNADFNSEIYVKATLSSFIAKTCIQGTITLYKNDC